VKKKKKKSLAGHLLAASRELRDPNFFRTVILLIRHNDEGALGLVLNRPTNTTLREVWSQVDDSPCQHEGVLHMGGPVQGPLMALHTEEFMLEEEVLPGLYFSASTDNLQRLVSGEHQPVAFFVGYAGWGAGQLENELKEGSWLVAPASPGEVFDQDDRSWDRLVRRVVGQQLFKAMQIKHVPNDPRVN
jgi:putative transcriptional regulator